MGMDPIVEGLYQDLAPERLDSRSSVASADSHKEEHFSILEELRNPGYAIPQIAMNTFVDNLLPPLQPGISVKNTVKTLKKAGILGSKGKRKHSRRSLRNHIKKRADDTFASLVEIFNKATSTALQSAPHLEQTIDMVLLPKCRRNADGTITQSSACFTLKNTGKRCLTEAVTMPKSISWFDVAFTAKFSGTNSEASCKINGNRIARNIQQIMVRDPSRRFTFGITVEDTNMRLWFCSRSTPVVSEAFDFTADSNLLIHVLLSLAFASKEELGWDPTMRTFIQDDGERAFHMDVNGETYETVRILTNSSAEEVVGHATRVWVVRHHASRESYVLKDVWIEDGRELEHTIYEDILRDIEAKYCVDVRKEVASHLLTPVMHWLVRVNGVEDHTIAVMMRGHQPSFRRTFKVETSSAYKTVSSASCSCAAGGVEIRDPTLEDLKDPLPWCNPLRKVIGRKHYRVVFKEIASSVLALRNFADVFTVLEDSAKALSWIHGCGWVHRDISVGNLYLYHGRGLIGDLEYAKRKNTDTDNESRIGTPEFMAIEASERLYDFLPRQSADELEAERKALIEGRWEEVRSMEESKSPPPFFHNDLHDLESLWWIAVWVLFSNCSDGGVISEDTKQKARRQAALNAIFRSTGRGGRRLFLKQRHCFSREVAWMPDCLRSIRMVLDTLRRFLNYKYTNFESNFPDIRIDVLEDAHVEFIKHFGRCRELMSDDASTPYIPVVGAPRLIVVEETMQAQIHTCVPAHTDTVDCAQSIAPLNTSRKDAVVESLRQPATTDDRVPEKYLMRNGKRKRNDEDDMECLRPFRVARYVLIV